MYPRSIRQTFAPYCRARSAQALPPLPHPITIKSNCCSALAMLILEPRADTCNKMKRFSHAELKSCRCKKKKVPRRARRCSVVVHDSKGKTTIYYSISLLKKWNIKNTLPLSYLNRICVVKCPNVLLGAQIAENDFVNGAIGRPCADWIRKRFNFGNKTAIQEAR